MNERRVLRAKAGCRALLLVALVASPESRAADADDAWGASTTAELPGEVAAEDAIAADGVYGRFDGDLELGAAVGAELEDESTRLLVAASAHYYWMAGVYGTYREALGAEPDEPTLERIGSVGVDLRPLFVPRWSFAWQVGPPTLDLFLDSISLAGGAYFADAPRELEAARRGFEASLGAGVPLLGSAEGPWLSFRYDVRWPEAGDATGSFWLMLGWHLLVSTPLARTTGAVF